MSKTFRCVNCSLEKPGNYRLKAQQYCGDEVCQRVRRREYQNNRRVRDAAYQQSQRNYRRAWREKHALAQYQRAYRDAHPDYVEKNRQQQRERNRKRRARELPQATLVIVKMNSCSAIKPGSYLLLPCQVDTSRMIVSDSFDPAAKFGDIGRIESIKANHFYPSIPKEVTMLHKTLLMPERKRVLAPPFAWIDRRFLFDGFLAANTPQENLLYFFLVLAADRDGVSFYSYDKICTRLKLDADDYIQARNDLMRKQLIAFDGHRFQVLALPKSPVAERSVASQARADRPGRDAEALASILARLSTGGADER